MIREEVDKNILALVKYIHTLFNNDSQIPTPFTASAVPSITIHDYVTRILENIEYPDGTESFVIHLAIYLRRLSLGFSIDAKSIHRLIAVSSLITAKNSDFYFSNAFYASLFGLSLNELNKLEFMSIQYLWETPDTGIHVDHITARITMATLVSFR